eukprot:1009233-Prorocentrum_lima.AAC.1
MFRVAMSRYSWKRRHPMHNIAVMKEVPQEVRDFDSRLSIMLLKSLPVKMKARVFEGAEGDDMWVDIST